MNRIALRLSLAHGHGDIHWFSKLPREDRALMLAYDQIQANPNAYADAVRRAAPPRDASEILRERAAKLAARRP